MLRIDRASPRGNKLVGGLYERSVGWWLWEGEGHSKFLCCPSEHFFSSFILFNDLHFYCPALRTESQRLSVGSRRNDEHSVTRGSRVWYSTLRGRAGRAASTVQSQHSVRCHICHAHVQTVLCGLEKSHAAQVALSAP